MGQHKFKKPWVHVPLEEGLAADYGILSATHLNHIEEASKAKLQIRRIERDLPKAIEETGWDSKKVALMHRYDYKRNVEDPARSLANKIKAVSAAAETLTRRKNIE